MCVAKKWYRFKELPSNIWASLSTLPELFAQSNVRLAYLFGSLAETETGNDVDLAILTQNVPPYTLRDILTAHLGTERIDILDLSQASPAFSFDIVRTGHLLYAADEEERLQFELGVVRRFHDTAYLRQRQEQALKRRMTAWSSSATAS